MGTIENVVEWHAESSTAPGESKCGDVHLVRPFPGGVLLAAVDGLGHGEEAEAAARAARAVLDRHAEEPVISLVERCHATLRSTRGVVLSLASYRLAENALTWIGVGNVEGALMRKDAQGIPRQEWLLLRRGIVGSHLPRLMAGIVPVFPSDLLILATDGVECGFADHVRMGDSPDRIARRILAECARPNDDALVLVARFLHGRDEDQAGSTRR